MYTIVFKSAWLCALCTSETVAEKNYLQKIQPGQHGLSDTLNTYTQKEKIMSNKSGFEIRADLLNQAQGILECNLQRKIQSAQEWNAYNQENQKEVPSDEISTADVIKAAKELYEFVNDKQ